MQASAKYIIIKSKRNPSAELIANPVAHVAIKAIDGEYASCDLIFLRSFNVHRIVAIAKIVAIYLKLPFKCGGITYPKIDPPTTVHMLPYGDAAINAGPNGAYFSKTTPRDIKPARIKNKEWFNIGFNESIGIELVFLTRLDTSLDFNIITAVKNIQIR